MKNFFIEPREGNLLIQEDGSEWRKAAIFEELEYYKNKVEENERLNNIITLTDAYKFSHWRIYPKNTKKVYSYFESRTGATWNKTMFFGLQYIIKKYLSGQVVTQNKINRGKRVVDSMMVDKSIFNQYGWDRMLQKHNGRLPIIIKAVPEGLKIPVSNVLMTIENTDEEFGWLTNYLETLLVQVWSPSTVATNSYEQKKILLQYLEETGDPSLIDFKLHDFSFRGDSSVETAAVSGAGNLLNFKGTDTSVATEMLDQYYNSLFGWSIPATEHSQMTILGRNGEKEMMNRVLTEFPDGLVACVSDSFDIYNACANIWGDALKEVVLARNGCLVIRPDSGDAKKILPDIIKILGDKFGFTKNSKGYFVLNPKVRVIQGDHVNINTLKEYLEVLKQNQISADNIAFGSGGALVQMVNRDTQRFAFKCSAADVNGEWRDVFKDPITDGGKRSKAGKLALIKTENGYETIPENELGDRKNILETVFENGELKKDYNFDEIRKNTEME